MDCLKMAKKTVTHKNDNERKIRFKHRPQTEPSEPADKEAKKIT